MAHPGCLDKLSGILETIPLTPSLHLDTLPTYNNLFNL